MFLPRHWGVCHRQIRKSLVEGRGFRVIDSYFMLLLRQGGRLSEYVI